MGNVGWKGKQARETRRRGDAGYLYSGHLWDRCRMKWRRKGEKLRCEM